MQPAFDFQVLKRALEESDATQLIGLYDDDAEMTIIDRDRPPSAPMRLGPRQRRTGRLSGRGLELRLLRLLGGSSNRPPAHSSRFCSSSSQ